MKAKHLLALFTPHEFIKFSLECDSQVDLI